jgi:hypothetical protein
MDGVFLSFHDIDTRWESLALLCTHLSNHTDEPPPTINIPFLYVLYYIIDMPVCVQRQ